MQLDNILGYSPRTYLMSHGGIYMIRSITTGRVYIGQTISFWDRVSAHRTALRNDKHSIALLQTDWNAYGAKNFKFEVLIAFRHTLFVQGYIEPEQMTDLEIEYWEQHKSNCYNARKPYLSSWKALEPYRPRHRAA